MRGQASADYVGLLAVVALIVTVAAGAITSPPLAAGLTGAVRHGICVVAGGICTPREARHAGLDACVVHVRSDADEVGAVVAVIRLQRGDTAVVERRSDGTATISFLDGNGIGAQTSIGLQLPGVGAGGSASAAAGLAFNTGRSYEFGTWAAGTAFLARYADAETTAGEGRNLAWELSPLHEPRRLPAAHSTSFETGTWAQLEADLAGSLPGLGAAVTGTGSAALSRVIGRRRSGKRTTWYFRVDGDVAGRLGVVAAAVGGGAAGEAVLEVTAEGDRLVAAAVTGSAGVTGELSLYGHTTDLGRLADHLRRASAGAAGAGESGMAMQAGVSLDLTVVENHAALVGALDVLRLRAAPRDWPERIGRLGARLNSDGRVDVSVYRSASSAKEQSAEFGLGLGAGFEHVRTQATRELVQAWSARGGALREREDCLTAAA